MSYQQTDNPANLDTDDTAYVTKATSKRTTYHTEECQNVRCMDTAREKEWVIVRRMGLDWCEHCQRLQRGGPNE